MITGESSLLRRTCLGLPVAIGLAGLCAPVQAQPYQAPPVDQAGEVPEFAAWRDILIDAVRRRDTEAVVALADPAIRLSFGDSSGRDTFRAWLNGIEDMPGSGEVYWQALEDALALGGTWEDWDDGGRAFCAPYTFKAEFPPELEVFDVAMVVQADAELRRGPDLREPVVATLGYDILVVDDWGWNPEHPEEPHWMSVHTTDGAHAGWIESTAVRSPVDYRACFTEAESGWALELFVAGD
jgi:hypothetical protein